MLAATTVMRAALPSRHGSRGRCIKRHAVDLDQVAVVQLWNRNHRARRPVLAEGLGEYLVEQRQGCSTFST
jgi:hypothetical protein